MSSLGKIWGNAGNNFDYNHLNPFSQEALQAKSENLLSSFDANSNQSLQKCCADRIDTMWV